MIYTAIHTAIAAHGDQRRKLDNDLYVAHPIEVGMILAKHGLPDEVIIAGLLHDTLEDTSLTYEEIQNTFGSRVAMYVAYCTEKNKKDPWKKRKIDYLKGLENAPLDVLYIVCVDKLVNLSSVDRHMEEHGPALWEAFNAGYEEQKWYYTAILEVLTPISVHPLCVLLEQLVKKVFQSP